jgi:hypothetical protein
MRPGPLEDPVVRLTASAAGVSPIKIGVQSPECLRFENEKRRCQLTRVLKFLVICSVCLVLTPQAEASWSSPASTGTNTGVGNPSCAFVSTKLVACAVRTNKAAIMVNDFNGTKWAGWKTLAMSVTSDPSCTGNGGGSVICAATSTTGGMEVSIFNGTAWSTPTTVTGALYSGPSCAELPAESVLCVARAATGGLSWTTYNGTTWKAFATLATAAYSAPSCTTDNNNGVVCAAFTTGGATLVNRFASGKWTSFLNIGGIAGSRPDCTSMNSAGRVACFAEAYNSGIYVNVYNGSSWTVGNWSSYEPLGGTVNENAGCTTQSAGELACGAVSVVDSAFYTNVYNGSSWTGWEKIGGAGVGSPSCAPLGTGEVVCLIMGPTNTLSSSVGP